MTTVVLSLFPGIGLLDRAFEEEGFTIVRGPDLLWGGDIRCFHPPAGRFDGVVGGPPCQAFSNLGRLNRTRAENLIPEFERCIVEAKPRWFLMENVLNAPEPRVERYTVQSVLLNNRWCGGEQNRMRRFSFGINAGLIPRFEIPGEAFEAIDYKPAVTASATVWDPIKQRPHGDHSERYFRDAVKAQGLPQDFDLPAFTVREKIRAVGNGVPLPMGRAVARAVKEATR